MAVPGARRLEATVALRVTANAQAAALSAAAWWVGYTALARAAVYATMSAYLVQTIRDLRGVWPLGRERHRPSPGHSRDAWRVVSIEGQRGGARIAFAVENVQEDGYGTRYAFYVHRKKDKGRLVWAEELAPRLASLSPAMKRAALAAQKEG